MVSFGTACTQITVGWSEWKAAYEAVNPPRFRVDTTNDAYVFWFYDGFDLFICRVWKDKFCGDTVDGEHLNSDAWATAKRELEESWLSRAG